jgi:hypothetical protein
VSRARKEIQDLWGAVRVRTVIERQRDALGPGGERPGDAKPVCRRRQNGCKSMPQHAQMIAHGH